jgi:hypothetical protein
MPGFFRQWNKYCGLRGMVVCEQIAPRVPEGWSFMRTGYDHDGKRWVGNLQMALKQVYADVVLLVLDDYWLTKQADVIRIQSMANSMAVDQDIDKIDLTNDRIGFANTDYNEDYVRSNQDAQYLTSTQAALWRTIFLQTCLSDPSWNPWQFELIGTKEVAKRSHKILGCRIPAIHYANVMLKGEINQQEVNKLSAEDQQSIDEIGVNK